MYPKKRKRTKKVISLMTVFAMLSSSMGTTAAAASVRLDSQAVLLEESELNVPDSQSALPEALEQTEPVSVPVMKASKTVTPPAVDGDGIEPDNKPDDGKTDAENLAAAEKAGELSYSEVYNKMIALKNTYPEGMTWTNFEPYGTRGKDPDYLWKGGKILNNVERGVGCAAFAFILSDEAFGELKARELYDKDKFSIVRPGDILRLEGNSHSVIVLQKTAAGVIIAEGNYNKSVHWGRALSKDDVNRAEFIVTRYPENYETSGADAVETVAEQGNDGSLSWTLTDKGTLTISGSGDMRNFTQTDRPKWEEKKLQINAVVVENGVTSIGNYAFNKNSSEQNIVSVSIPGSVQNIGDYAFYNCTNLLSVTIPEGVKSIGTYAFMTCSGLKYIDFPSTITTVGDGAFQLCSEIYSIRFKPGNETVSEVRMGEQVFAQCYKLVNVVLPDKTSRIGSGAFTSCNALTELYLPAGITELGKTPGPFPTNLKILNFAGDEAKWQQLQGGTALNNSGLPNLKPNFNIAFPNPFKAEANDPGDGMGGAHVHSWSSSEWNHDDSYHWHECSAAGCTITANSEKDSYAEHSYGSWVTDVNAASSQSGSRHRDCTVCSYRQTESIPATGGSTGGSGSSGGSGSTGGSWGSGSGTGSTGGTGTTVKPETPDTPDNTDNTSGSTDNESDSSVNNGTSGGQDSSDSSENITDNDNTVISASEMKQLKTNFKKELKTDLKKQIKTQLNTVLKKQLKTELKLQSKVKLKKQLKAELKPQLKAKLKKQLKKQYGETFGKEFADIFNLEFNTQFRKLYNSQFNTQYKKLSAKQTKK